jgi:hypothetical protein
MPMPKASFFSLLAVPPGNALIFRGTDHRERRARLPPFRWEH